ncbi:MAG: PIN domain protein, partial [Candidatus Eremiobacterota bacterium]
MRIYLDNCCFNRPFDNQIPIRIKLETEAKLYIQEEVINGSIELVWSYILEYENSQNPFEYRRNAINLWKKIATIEIIEDEE